MVFHNLSRKILFFKNHIKIARGSIISHKTEIGRYTRINAASHIGTCTIGAFCAIAGRLIVRSANHHVNYLNMQDYFQTTVLKSKIKVAGKTKGDTCIGHGVWIGDSVIVLSGVKIGNGAVIGAGSVVTKSIPPFSIAVGNPARVIKQRFSTEIIKAIEDLEWWNWDTSQLKNNKHLFEIDLDNVSLKDFKGAIDKVINNA